MFSSALPIPLVVSVYALVVLATILVMQPWAAFDCAQILHDDGGECILRDHANVTVRNDLPHQFVELHWVSTACVGCALHPPCEKDAGHGSGRECTGSHGTHPQPPSWGLSGHCSPRTNCSLQLPSDFPVKLQLWVKGEAAPISERTIALNEHAWYEWTITNATAPPTPAWVQTKPGNALNGAMPLVVFLLVLAGLAILGGVIAPAIVGSLRKTYAREPPPSCLREPLAPQAQQEDTAGTATVAAGAGPPAPADRTQAGARSALKPTSERLRSLDTFRGGCLIVMIFVNYGGGRYWFLSHSVWNGLTLADTVFPWFVWMMGASTALSQHSAWRRSATRTQCASKAAVRTLKLLAVAFFLDNRDGVKFDEIRIPGVLQYFAFAGALLAAAHLLLDWTSTNDDEGRNARRSVRSIVAATAATPAIAPACAPVCPEAMGNLIRFSHRATLAVPELVPFWREWMAFGVVLLAYLLLQQLLPVPGCPTGYLGPGGNADGGKYAGCTGGAHRRIDELLWGAGHYYDGPTCRQYYQCGPYDPEGTLGALTASVLAFQGMLAGRVLVAHKSHASRLRRWLTYGVICSAIGLGLSGGLANDGLLPINKNLWSPSFVFTLSGLGYFVLAALYVLIDQPSPLRVWSGMPLRPLGMNSIVIYAGSELFGDGLPFSWDHPDTHAQALGCNLCGVLTWILIAWLLHRHRFYVNL